MAKLEMLKKNMVKLLEYVGISDNRYVCIINGELYVSDPMAE